DCRGAGAPPVESRLQSCARRRPSQGLGPRRSRRASRTGGFIVRQDPSRRDLLRTAARAGAAGLVAPASRLAHAATISPEWEQMAAAARKEGKVSVNTFTGQGYARILKLFAQAYPEIKLEHTNLEPVEFSPRVIQERKASVYTWDVATMPMSTALQVLKPAGVWDPVRPVIVAPEAKNNANWRGGFDAGFLDHDRNLAYAFTLVRAPGVFVNVDQVKEGELRSVKDLLLTKDAQVAWARELQTNSRFVGVEPGDPQAVVPPGLTLLQIDAEEQLPELIKTQDIARQLIR